MSIIFPATATRRLSVRLREMSIDQAIGLCGLPAERPELTLTEMLRGVAASEQLSADHIGDPRLWSVEERALLVTKYLAEVCPDGPDFAVGAGRLSDFLLLDQDLQQDHVDLGIVGDKACTMVPLVGAAAQVLEVLCRKRYDWIVGAMACQMLVGGEEAPDWLTMPDVEGMKWVSARMDRLKALPESTFSEVYRAYWDGAARLTHFFNVDFDDEGIIMQPVEKEGADPMGPVRFPADACISSLARLLS